MARESTKSIILEEIEMPRFTAGEAAWTEIFKVRGLRTLTAEVFREAE